MGVFGETRPRNGCLEAHSPSLEPWYTYCVLNFRFEYSKGILTQSLQAVSWYSFFMYAKEENQYLAWKGTYRPAATVSKYEQWLDRFTESAGKGIEEVTPTDIATFSLSLQENYAPKTQEYAMTILHDYVGYWAKRKPLKILLDDIRVRRSRANSHKPITPEEYVSMLSFIKVTPLSGLRDNALVRLLYDTGARISEIASLSVEACDLVARQAQIHTAKRREDGFIFWGKDTNEFLRVYIEQTQPEGEIFPCVRTCQRIVKKYALLAGIKKHITAHSFRHGKAWRVLDNGGTVKDVQLILRHKDPASSFKYFDFHEQKNRERAERFL